MTMQACAYGRVGQDPRSIETRSGKAMVVGSIAVSIDENDAPPLWIGIVAFGRVAEDFLRHSKGDLISVSGRVQRNSWTTPAGEKREQLQIVADALVSSRTVRPAGGRKRDADDRTSSHQSQPRSERELDDEIPF
ncbi:single-stranded DNA-binding protein [Nitratireductor thuwali]|uniref:Single-stranded DNA-binding protein n=1 Tax=Nitratireductor thuwali TaxID=2267699 RepID=A0ABY5MQF3_9HYPH|nr:Single-stranded DNA-binding protein [Nitratireductor thuwali]